MSIRSELRRLLGEPGGFTCTCGDVFPDASRFHDHYLMVHVAVRDKSPGLVLVEDPDWGGCALYIDGQLLWDFYAEGLSNQWRQAIQAIEETYPGLFELESRHALAKKIPGYFDVPDEWESYWPEKLADAPLPRAWVQPPTLAEWLAAGHALKPRIDPESAYRAGDESSAYRLEVIQPHEIGLNDLEAASWRCLQCGLPAEIIDADNVRHFDENLNPRDGDALVF